MTKRTKNTSKKSFKQESSQGLLKHSLRRIRDLSNESEIALQDMKSNVEDEYETIEQDEDPHTEKILFKLQSHTQSSLVKHANLFQDAQGEVKQVEKGINESINNMEHKDAVMEALEHLKTRSAKKISEMKQNGQKSSMIRKRMPNKSKGRNSTSQIYGL